MNNRQDDNWMRIKECQRPLGVALRAFHAFPRLYSYCLEMPDLPLYSPEASRAARDLVRAMFPGVPAYWKLELGEGGRLHLHVIASLPPMAVPGAMSSSSVYDLAALMAYLSKPADARLCRPGRLKPWTPDPSTRARNRYRAEDERGEWKGRMQAIGRKRFSPLSGWVNLPRLAPLSPWVALLSRAFLLSLLLMGAGEIVPRPAPKVISRRPIPGRPGVVKRVLRPARPPPRTRVQVPA